MTAIASGAGSVGVRSEYNDVSEPGSLHARTRELDRPAARQPISRRPEEPGTGASDGPGNIVVSNSNFDVTGVGRATGSQRSPTSAATRPPPPVFVDAANGDYREAAGSPTIDAGIADQLGPLDLAGNTRVLGSAPDIGAYEFVPPPAVPLPPAAGTDPVA